MQESAVIARLKERIRERRLELSLTQEEVARRAGVGLRRYQELEGITATARDNPTLRTLVRIAIALEVDVEYLFASHPGSSPKADF